MCCSTCLLPNVLISTTVSRSSLWLLELNKVMNDTSIIKSFFIWTHCCPWNYFLDILDLTWLSPPFSHLFCCVKFSPSHLLYWAPLCLVPCWAPSLGDLGAVLRLQVRVRGAYARIPDTLTSKRVCLCLDVAGTFTPSPHHTPPEGPVHAGAPKCDLYSRTFQSTFSIFGAPIVTQEHTFINCILHVWGVGYKNRGIVRATPHSGWFHFP